MFLYSRESQCLKSCLYQTLKHQLKWVDSILESHTIVAFSQPQLRAHLSIRILHFQLQTKAGLPCIAFVSVCIATSVFTYLAPSGAPEMFEAVPGERVVEFSWSPPPITQRNGPLTSYNISCSPSLPSQPLTIPAESRPSFTVTGLTPNTDYTCSVTADNSRGSGPPENGTFTTMEDCKICWYYHHIAVSQNALFAVKYFQLRLSGLLTTCSDLVVSDNIIILTWHKWCVFHRAMIAV